MEGKSVLSSLQEGDKQLWSILLLAKLKENPLTK